MLELAMYKISPEDWLFGSMLDEFLSISENTNAKQLAKAYEKLAISGKVLTKEEN